VLLCMLRAVPSRIVVYRSITTRPCLAVNIHVVDLTYAQNRLSFQALNDWHLSLGLGVIRDGHSVRSIHKVIQLIKVEVSVDISGVSL